MFTEEAVYSPEDTLSPQYSSPGYVRSLSLPDGPERTRLIQQMASSPDEIVSITLIAVGPGPVLAHQDQAYDDTTSYNTESSQVIHTHF